MAYLLDIGDLFSVNIDARLFGQQILFTTHWRFDSVEPGTTVQAEETFEAWAAFLDSAEGWGKAYADSVSQSLTGLTYVFQRIQPVRMVSKRIASTFTEGQVAEDSLPPNTSHVLTLRCDETGRNKVGNRHIAAVPPSFTENGMITADGITALSGLGETLMPFTSFEVGLDTLQFGPVIYHRDAIPTYSEITNYSIQQTTRVERRRTVGLGS